MSEGRAPISSSRIAIGDIARHSFAIVRRGFDTDEVRSYLQSVSRNIEALEEREQELRDAVAEAEERAAHPVVDEATLTASLGQHSAQILRHAHEEAAKIVAQAQEGSATLLRETHTQVEELQANTEAASAERVAQVELLVANARQEAREESERILAEAVADGEAVIARAKDEGRALLEQVQEARRRVLSDLAARRRALGIQIEQLRAARDELTATVHGARDRVDGILAHLDRTDDQARAAALAVGEHYRLHGGEPDVAGDGDEAHEAVATGPLDQDALGDVVEDTPEGAPTALIRIEDMDTSSRDAATPDAAPSVDELFARIRAGAAESDDDAQRTDPGPASGAKAGPTAGSTTPAAPEAVSTTPAAPEARASAETLAATRAIPVVEPGSTGEPGSTEEPETPPGPDDPLIARRDELLGPVTARLSRTVKRTLGDDQNRLLDRIRSGPSLTIEDLLGTEDEQLDLFSSAVRGQLTEAFAAGTVFAGTGVGVPEGDAVERSSAALSRVVVTMLRRRIAEGSEEPGDRVGAAFREWRGERVDRLAGDYATQAFSAGVTAAGSDGKLRWVVTSRAGCSDCADNALAGAVSASESFPTGHLHPPAHSGCRCLVAPTDA
jgi:cell division septum initiation protein DivIVA